MALSSDEVSLINSLARRHAAEIPELDAYDSYYEGTQGLTYMHPEIWAEVNERIKPVIVNWPQMTVDSVAERLRHEGFKTGDKDLDKELLRVWQANDMILGFRQAMVDAMVMRRAYVCVGTNEDDEETPLVTPESPLELFADIDPRTRKVRAALRRVSEVDQAGATTSRYATLYLPDQTIWCVWDGGWKESAERDRHGLGMVPVVPVVNRPRLRATVRRGRQNVERMGRSDLDSVIPLSEAACKAATDMMVAAEFVALPLRAIFGAGPDEFRDEQGNPMTPLKALQGRLLAIPDDEVKAYEFAAAQLQNFTTALEALAKMVVSVSGLPPHYMGQSGDNPASAEAIAGSEARLNTKAELKHDYFGTPANMVAKLIRRFQLGKWDDKADQVTSDWRNVRTPTIAAMSDAALKLYTTTPKPIVPLRQTREALGYDETEIEAMEEEDEKEAERSPVAQLARAAGSGNANAE